MTTKTFSTRATFELDGKKFNFYSLKNLETEGLCKISTLPYSIKILLESLLRQFDGNIIREEHITNLAKWGTQEVKNIDVPFKPARVILQDFTGVPAVVDLASLRKAMSDMGGNPNEINPEIPVDLVIDHSVQVDKSGTYDSLSFNEELEFKRNTERYKFLKWAQNSFSNYRVIPPDAGIIHQINLEYLADVISTDIEKDNELLVFPDTVVGTDSHTTMINGIGVLGWGVGGIEAEAGMLGHPSFFPVPDVVGVKLLGSLQNGTTATDAALQITKILREKGVVGKFVEFFGPGLKHMPLADRATISNMAPEYGATCGFFPVDAETLTYLKLTGRTEEQVRLVEAYCKENNLFYTEDSLDPTYTNLIEIDLASIEASLSGPKRPQDLIPLSDMQKSFQNALTAPRGNHGFGLKREQIIKKAHVKLSNNRDTVLDTGSIVVAAITSCTNTSNPYVMIGAGLLAKKAVEKGLKVPPHIKTSLAPGSRAVTNYLKDSGLLPYLEKLGFNIVGYGCTTCINAGPLADEIEKAIVDNDLLVSSVISGNRNFEGRIHPLVKASYLASPPLVVAYALTGTVNINLYKDPIGQNTDGENIYLEDIWPTTNEIKTIVKNFVTPHIFKSEYENILNSNDNWNKIQPNDDSLYNWDENSTYIQNPPFFENLSKEVKKIEPLSKLRVLGKFGDSITTDHISPASAIVKTTPAGMYLQEKGVTPINFNTYGSRRGNHEIMMRGTFANTRIRNQIAPDTEGGWTTYWPTGEITTIYEAAMKYKEEGTGLVIIAGKDYGMGSSRDWAAKGTSLLGVKAVIAESFERIHRSNLVFMGVLPLQFKKNENAQILGLNGNETFEIHVNENITPHSLVKICATKEDGHILKFEAIARFDSQIEIEYYRHEGILPMILRQKFQKTPN